MLCPSLVERDRVTAALWYFQYEGSLPFRLDMLGYTLLAAAFLVIATGFAMRARILRWIARIMLPVAVTSVAPFVFLSMGLDDLVGTTRLLSAGPTVPPAVLAIGGRDWGEASRVGSTSRVGGSRGPGLPCPEPELVPTGRMAPSDGAGRSSVRSPGGRMLT